MQSNATNQREIKIAVIGVLIVFLVIVTGFAFILKGNLQESIDKDLKISVLIDEVGELKQDSEELYQQMRNRNKNLLTIQILLNDLHKDIAELQESGFNKQAALQELEKTQKELVNVIQDRENTISSLSEKNERMQEENDHVLYNSKLTNILILGQNQGLTDTIIVASINPSIQRISLISVPRDLYYGGRKINELYTKYGIEKLEGAIKEVTSLPIDKYVVFDFEALIKMVDVIGGIDMTLEKDLIDESYPGPNNSYIKVAFKKGSQHMDGDTALKYARSRKSTTDFDRSRRQQEIIRAIEQKTEELNILNKFDLALKMEASVRPHVKTNVSFFEALSYYSSYRDYPLKDSNVISNQNFLYSTTSKAGQYILLPVKGDYSDIQKYVSNLVSG